MEKSGRQVHKEVKEGERYGKLSVLSYIGTGGGCRKWRCRCDCGNITEVQEYHLKSGHTTRNCPPIIRRDIQVSVT